MLDITSLTSLVDALRAETAKDSISPESLGSILQKILDLLNTAASDSDMTTIKGNVAALQLWRSTISKIKTVITALSLDSSDSSSVTLAMSQTALSTGLSSMGKLVLPQATTEQAGVMTTAQVNELATLKEKAEELADTCTKLTTRINDLYTTQKSRYTSLNEAITEETTTRKTKDESLSIRIYNETLFREEADKKLQTQIDTIKVNASTKPFYHRQCDSSNNVLTMKGASFLVSQGYTPLLFRYTVRQGRNGHKRETDGKRCWQKVRRGWHLCYLKGKVHISGNNIEFYDEQQKTHSTDPKVLFNQMTDIYDGEGKLQEVRVGFGKRTYNVIGHHRFRFAIAFAKKPVFNEPFDFNTLITNLAEFRVHVSAPNGAEKADFVFSI